MTIMQAVVLPVTQPFTMGPSPTKEPLLGPSGGSLTHRRISYARMGPPLAKRRSSDEPDSARSVSEFDWGGDMTTTSRTASRSRRSSVSEHAFPQVNNHLHDIILLVVWIPSAALSHKHLSRGIAIAQIESTKLSLSFGHAVPQALHAQTLIACGHHHVTSAAYALRSA